jgi:dTDP-4-amino-4,6-dideoxygalactose transaminase
VKDAEQQQGGLAEESRLIPLIDLKAQYASIKPAIDAAVQRVLDETAFVLGPQVESFETAFARYCEVRHAIGISSGTAALQLALLACGVGPGDEVITSCFTFIATAEAISHAGARPVLVDINPDDFNLVPEQVEAAIGPRTKAIIPVHLFGWPADLDRLLDIACRHRLELIEDAAQAHGARYRGRRVGTFGKAACFSFYPGKNLGAYGDAGMVVTGDDALAARLRLLRDHGRRTKYEHVIVGHGERLDTMQGAVLEVKLPHLDGWNAARRHAAARYRELLADLPLVLPADFPNVESVYHLFVIRTADRDRVLHELLDAGIGAGVHYPIPLHLQPAYAHLGYGPGSFPVAEQAAREVLSIPLYPEITQAQLCEVADRLRAALGR